MNIRLIIACHKPCEVPADPMYLPVHVGSAGKETMPGFTRDDEGDSISEKNPVFCELTGLYWAWKNLDCDALGLVHYRRYFTMKRRLPGKEAALSDVLSGQEAEQLLEKYQVIVPKKRHYYIETVWSHYCHTFDGSQFETARQIIAEGKGKYTADETEYIRTVKDNGVIKVYAYINNTQAQQSNKRLILLSALSGGGMFILLMVVIYLVSRRAVRPISQSYSKQKEFISNASHELKTPLAVISANTEVIEMMNGKNEWTESTVNQVSRMSELISRLVVLSRLEEREDIVLKDVDYSAEAAKSVANFKTVAETKGLTLESVIEEDIHVEADEKGIFELINILLDNAVKYCDDGGAILIVLSKKGKYSSLVVSNDYAEGEGVDYKRFFDRFYREDQSHNSSKKGYGIGLSMAESLTRMFKGKIHVTYKKPIISFTVII